MEVLTKIIQEHENSHEYINNLLENMDHIIECNKRLAETVTTNLVDKGFLDDIENIDNFSNVNVYFGKSLRDVKIEIPEDNGYRSHDIFIEYKSPKKLIVTHANLPHSSIQNVEYSSLNDIIDVFSRHIAALEKYFYELEQIDQFCSVMEPVNASYKEDFRRIFLDERTWLHVEVTPEGLASNIHLVGHSVYWHNKLQSGLLTWDHDKNIVDNIRAVFDLSTFPQASTKAKASELKTQVDEESKNKDALVCKICLCEDIPEAPGVPQPLCQYANCGVYYHRTCLYQWLVACSGNRPPAFGVANGACPTCLQPITCSEKDT